MKRGVSSSPGPAASGRLGGALVPLTVPGIFIIGRERPASRQSHSDTGHLAASVPALWLRPKPRKRARSVVRCDVPKAVRSGRPDRLQVRVADDEAEAAMAAGVAGAIPPFCTECPEAEQALPTAVWTPFARGAAWCTQHHFTRVSLTLGGRHPRSVRMASGSPAPAKPRLGLPLISRGTGRRARSSTSCRWARSKPIWRGKRVRLPARSHTR
jgi:hypothetical protein